MDKETMKKLATLERAELVEWLIEEIEDNERWLRLMEKLVDKKICTKRYKKGIVSDFYDPTKKKSCNAIIYDFGDFAWQVVRKSII